MKKTVLLIAIILVSCSGKSEYQKEAERLEIKISDAMYYKAKASSYPHQGNFNGGMFYRSSINDSIVFCQQNFTYKNDYGVKKSGKVYGYFNSRTGEDVTSMIDFYANSTELSIVPRLIK